MLHLWSSYGFQKEFTVLFDIDEKKMVRFSDGTIEGMES